MTEEETSIDETKVQDAVQDEVQTEVPAQSTESEDQSPPTRKTPQDYILERQVKKRKEAEERAQVLEQELEILRGTGSESVIKEQVSHDMLEHTRTLERKLEIKDFLATNPAFAGYEAKMLKWSEDPAYARVPAQQLAYAIAGQDLRKMNPSGNAEAEREAASSQVLGGSVAQSEPKKEKSIRDMSDQEFLQHQYRIKRGA